MAIKNEIVDELLKDVDPKKVFSSEGLLSDIKNSRRAHPRATGLQLVWRRQ